MRYIPKGVKCGYLLYGGWISCALIGLDGVRTFPYGPTLQSLFFFWFATRALGLQKSQMHQFHKPYNKHLISLVCSVRTVTYGPSFFLPFMAQARSTRAMKIGRKKRGSISYRTDRVNEANKIFIIWLMKLVHLWFLEPERARWKSKQKQTLKCRSVRESTDPV